MGKGSRSRINRAEEVISNSGKKKTDNTKKITVIVTVLVVLLIAGFISAIILNNTGALSRAKTAAKSDNYRVSGTMLSYFFNSQYQSFVGNFGSYASYLGLDTSKSLKSQKCDMYEGADTWFDYFMNSTREQISEILGLCEAAKAEGVSLDKEDTDSIDSALESMATVAAQNGYSVGGYIAAAYGAGVSVNDVRKCLEMAELASKYLTSLSEKIEGEVTDDEINEYFEANPSTFLKADTLQYVLTATKSVEGAEATEEEEKAYEDAKAEKKALAEQLKAAATGADGFKAWVAGYLDKADEIGEEFESFFSSESEDLSEADRPSDEALAEAKTKAVEYISKCLKGEEATAPDFGSVAYADALDGAVSSTYALYITRGIEGLANDGITYSDPSDEDTSDLDKWLFAKDRAAGDVEVIESEGDSTSKYTVVFVTEPAHRSTELTKDVAHILISASTAGYDDTDTSNSVLASEKAKAEAEKILADFRSGEQTLEAFKKLGEEKTEDSRVVYENVSSGKMVTSFNDWIFDEARKAGDTDIVETEYGWHIMYFIGDGKEEWYATATEGVVSEKLEKWYEEASAKYHVTFNESVLNSVAD